MIGQYLCEVYVRSMFNKRGGELINWVNISYKTHGRLRNQKKRQKLASSKVRMGKALIKGSYKTFGETKFAKV